MYTNPTVRQCIADKWDYCTWGKKPRAEIYMLYLGHEGDLYWMKQQGVMHGGGEPGGDYPVSQDPRTFLRELLPTRDCERSLVYSTVEISARMLFWGYGCRARIFENPNMTVRTIIRRPSQYLHTKGMHHRNLFNLSARGGRKLPFFIQCLRRLSLLGCRMGQSESHLVDTRSTERDPDT